MNSIQKDNELDTGPLGPARRRVSPGLDIPRLLVRIRRRLPLLARVSAWLSLGAALLLLGWGDGPDLYSGLLAILLLWFALILGLVARMERLAGIPAARLKVPAQPSAAATGVAIQLPDEEVPPVPETEHLAHKTRMLEVLYDVATSVSTSRNPDELLNRVLDLAIEISGALGGVAYLFADDDQMRLIGSCGVDETSLPAVDRLGHDRFLCGDTDNYPDLRLLSADGKITSADQLQVIVVNHQYRGNTLGAYHLFVDREDYAPKVDVQHLLTSIGRHLGIAIEQARRDSEAKRLSIIEERSMLAGELHDSLAQTLASLRFQVSVLDRNLQPFGEYSIIHGIEVIENGLDQANTELRELITHFRAPVDDSRLIPAIAKLAHKLRDETGIFVFLQNEWSDDPLPAGTELQVLRIVQEALANVRKHSKAKAVRILLRSMWPNRYRVMVEDDGVGFDNTSVSEQAGKHVGLSIMLERTQRLNGDLRVDSEPGEGTQVELEFCYPQAGDETGHSGD